MTNKEKYHDLQTAKRAHESSFIPQKNIKRKVNSALKGRHLVALLRFRTFVQGTMKHFITILCKTISVSILQETQTNKPCWLYCWVVVVLQV